MSKYLIKFFIADSSKSALLGGFDRKSLSIGVSTPAFLRKIALWIAINPSSITSSMGAGGGCKPQYRFLGTWKTNQTWEAEPRKLKITQVLEKTVNSISHNMDNEIHGFITLFQIRYCSIPLICIKDNFTSVLSFCFVHLLRCPYCFLLNFNISTLLLLYSTWIEALPFLPQIRL